MLRFPPRYAPAILVLVACGCGEGPIETRSEDAAVGASESAATLEEGQIYGRDLPAGYVSLTYDDGPSASTEPIAELLHDMGIQATFFMNGCHFEGHPRVHANGSDSCRLDPSKYPLSLLRRIRDLGHRVANHTQDHAGLRDTPHNLVYQLARVQLTLDSVIDDDVKLLRPPGNAWNRDNAIIANGDAYLERLIGPFHHTIPGTGAGIQHDYQCLDLGIDPIVCASRLLAAAPASPRNRGIIQLHDRRRELDPDSAHAMRPYALTAHLVPALRRNGYTFVPLDAIPGVLGPRRFLEEHGRYWTHEFGDGVGWDVSESHWGSLRAANIDGDARVEICGRGNTGIKCVTSAGSRFRRARAIAAAFSDAQGYLEPRYGATLQFGDIDGDGDDDACARFRDGVYCARSRGRGGRDWEARPTRWSAQFSDAQGWGALRSYWGSLRLVDVTGDGRADLCGRSNAGIVCARARRGGGFARLRGWKGDDFGDRDGYEPAEYGATLQFGDIDGDGDMDVCIRAILGIRCAKNLGGRFGPSEVWTQGPFSDEDRWRTQGTWGSIRLADVDGDGDADICGRATTGVVCAFSDRSTFRGYQYLMNQRLRDEDDWDGARHGATLLFPLLDGDDPIDLCARGPAGLWCTTGSDALAE